MRNIYLFAAAALAMASCSSDEYLAGLFNPNKSNGEITFGTFSEKATRAGELTGAQAAEKLNNNFIVYGFKTSETTEAANGTGDGRVFDLYNVNYVEGTAGTTESNTANWEYVGYKSHTGSSEPEQTIKYWDYSAKSYVFSAVSGLGVTATKTLTGATVYDKGWTVSIPAGGDLSTLYASDRKPVEKANYQQQVDLTFRSLITKVRFAMYETVPGYSVHIDKFYYKKTSWENTETNFAINGTFKNANADAVTPLTITYYDDASGIENRPKVSYEDANVASKEFGIFGANIQATSALGTTSVEATYDQSDKSYTLILPYENASNNLELYVDYTLTSTGGSGEQIKVKHASAKVPANYTQWKPNFAYTYIFKISDNTNGTTGDPTNPDDPTVDPTDPKGLFPITFDAAVITEDTDVQETITSVSDPSITTYQKGIVATNNNEYVAGDDIYFENGTADVSTYKVYEVNNYGIEATTEEVVANWKKNFCVLTEVDVTYAPGDGASGAADFIPLSNGTFIQKKANQAAKFTPAAGKTYVIANKSAGDGTLYKVVKIEGSASAPVYTQSMGTATINTAATSAIFKLKSNSPKANSNVLGAAPLIKIFNGAEDVTTNFTITSGSSAGTYKITLTAAAIAAGANGNYTVKFNGNGDQTFNVNLTYTLTDNVVYVVPETKTATFTLTTDGQAISNAVVSNCPSSITIKETATAGTYEVSATKDATLGNNNITVAGQHFVVVVDSYEFYNVPEFTFNYLGTDDAKTLNLRKNYTDADVEVSAMTGINTSVATITKATAGAYTVVPVAPGTYTVTYENTSATIVVNQYTLTPSIASIAKSTGSTVLTLKKNNGETKTVNASTAKVTVKNGGSTVTSGFSLTTNGQTLKFDNVTTAGTYTFEYTENEKVVAVATVTVTE